MPKIEITSSKIANRSFPNFISNYFSQGLQSLLDRATHWLADIPKTIFAKTPFELNYADKNFWAAHFAYEMESLKVELIEGLAQGDLQSRLIELQGIIGKCTLSPVVYYQGLLELRAFSAHKKLTSHLDAVTNILQDFEAALHEQTALVRECFEGDSQLWLQQLVQPSKEIYEHVTHALTDYQRFTVPGVNLSLLLQLRQQAVAIAQTALIRNLTVMIFALERQGIQSIEKDEEEQAIEDEESHELLMRNEKESATKPAEKKDLQQNVFNTVKSWGEYVLNHPGQAITLGLAAQAAAAAALESSLAIKKSSRDRTLIEDIQQAAQQTPFGKLGQELAVGLAYKAQVVPDSSIQLPVAKMNTQLKNTRIVRTDNKGSNGAAPYVAGLNSDGFVVVIQQDGAGVTYEGVYDNILGSLYDPINNFSNYTQTFQINNFTAYTQAAPVAAGLNGGGFAVAWQSFNQAPDPGCIVECWDIYARTYSNSAMSMQAKEFLVNTNYTHLDQSQPAIAGLNNGGFVVSWQSKINGTYHVYAQLYNSTAVPLGDQFMVNTYYNGYVNGYYYDGYQVQPAIASLNSGDFVIAWQSYGQACLNLNSIYARLFDISGSPLSDDIQVDDIGSGCLYEDINVAIASLQDGGFVIIWQGQDVNYDIFGRQYNASGSPQGPGFQVNNYASSEQLYPSVAGLNNGGFVVTWNSYNKTGNGFFEIYAREYNPSNNALAGECLISTNTVGNQMYPVVTSLSNGNIVIAWQGLNYDVNHTILQPGFSKNCSVSCSINCQTTTVDTITTDTKIGIAVGVGGVTVAGLLAFGIWWKKRHRPKKSLDIDHQSQQPEASSETSSKRNSVFEL
jgi:hypothetical protein